ncbi:uncharacterized protein V1518DRAFT_416261 [Limtongia smithiae]|uniref:uncharacterized protein n=1 Tax=Limtongia smithiae TaxID=1125753 RepID=UPI0034CECB2F
MSLTPSQQYHTTAMAPAEFRSVSEASPSRHRKTKGNLSFFVKDMFTIRQMMLFGALAQLASSAILPSRYAQCLTLSMLSWTVIYTVWQSKSERNDFNADVILGKTSSQIPASAYNSATGPSLYGNKPGQNSVVVVHLGVRFNHALGPLASGGQDIGDLNDEMMKELEDCAEELGFLGVTAWRGNEGPSQNTLMTVFYFRTMEGLHTFAHSKAHRKGWDWYNKYVKAGNTSIGVFHEVFYSTPGSFETVYLNMPPVLLGATSIPTTDEATGKRMFVRPLVDASGPALKTGLLRMGRSATQDEKNAV